MYLVEGKPEYIASVVLDNLTLLFSLALISGLMAASLAVTARSGQHDGLLLWAVALALESSGWSFVAMRSVMPAMLSVLLANIALVIAQAVKLSAVYEYRGLRWPRWQSLLPLLAMLLLLSQLQVEDFRGRIMYGSLIYAAQMSMIVYALWSDQSSRGGRAWWLIYGSTLAILPILAARMTAAFISGPSFTPPLAAYAPSTVQLVVFVSMVALNLLGGLGFILLVKERTDREIRQLAMTDDLTGIFNRRAFMDRANREILIAQRNRLPLALLMFDIDHFKRVNDMYGHAAGDTVLAEISKMIAQRLRVQDTFGRYGGEEFCILLPATGEEGAWVLAENLRQAVESRRLQIGAASISVTISIGLSICNVQCTNCPRDFGNMLNDADRALYQGKSQGRNRTIVLPLSCDSSGKYPMQQGDLIASTQ
ncbi:MAG: diguanylate cyclase [Sideroxydans sp.]|nr:diguanylate cyclase [Sideroxydans sp.]